MRFPSIVIREARLIAHAWFTDALPVKMSLSCTNVAALEFPALMAALLVPLPPRLTFCRIAAAPVPEPAPDDSKEIPIDISEAWPPVIWLLWMRAPSVLFEGDKMRMPIDLP